MVKVTLVDGTVVEVPNGKRADFMFKTNEETVREVTEVGATLDVKDVGGYGGKIVASFLREKVVSYVVEPEEETEEA